MVKPILILLSNAFTATSFSTDQTYQNILNTLDVIGAPYVVHWGNDPDIGTDADYCCTVVPMADASAGHGSVHAWIDGSKHIPALVIRPYDPSKTATCNSGVTAWNGEANAYREFDLLGTSGKVGVYSSGYGTWDGVTPITSYVRTTIDDVDYPMYWSVDFENASVYWLGMQYHYLLALFKLLQTAEHPKCLKMWIDLDDTQDTTSLSELQAVYEFLVRHNTVATCGLVPNEINLIPADIKAFLQAHQDVFIPIVHAHQVEYWHTETDLATLKALHLADITTLIADGWDQAAVNGANGYTYFASESVSRTGLQALADLGFTHFRAAAPSNGVITQTVYSDNRVTDYIPKTGGGIARIESYPIYTSVSTPPTAQARYNIQANWFRQYIPNSRLAIESHGGAIAPDNALTASLELFGVMVDFCYPNMRFITPAERANPYGHW